MVKNYQPDVKKMYTYLRGYLSGANMTQSLIALQYARQKHAGQTRKNGVPYIVHPLSMACYAVALHIDDDNVIATILLHDVHEDCGVEIEALPVNNIVKAGVKYMSVQKFSTDEQKVTVKQRYYNELLESREAIICKAIDRYNNLMDAPFALTDDAIGKNAAETELFLLPLLKIAKEKWVDLGDVLHVLRTNIRGINDILKLKYEKSYNEWYEKYEPVAINSDNVIEQ